jgi:hypothetical protein
LFVIPEGNLRLPLHLNLPLPLHLPLFVLALVSVLAVILSASFEREEPREIPSRLNRPGLSNHEPLLRLSLLVIPHPERS